MNKETILQNQIIVALNKAGHYAENHTVGQFYTKYGNVVHVGTPGQCDIYGHRSDGRRFYIEVKLPGEQPRENQWAFIYAMKNSGRLSGVAHSIEEAFEIINEI